MNPRLHDEFVALCALFYSGELTDEEWALLQVHMAYCESCRRIFEEFKHVAREVVPAMAMAAAVESSPASYESDSAFAEAEQRLMSRLESVPQPKNTPATAKRRSWQMAGGALAAGFIVMMAFAAGRFLRKGSERTAEPEARAIVSQPAVVVPAPVRSATVPAVTNRDQAELADLRRQLNALQKSSRASATTNASLQQQLQTEEAQAQQIASAKQDLTQQLASAQANIQLLRDQLSTAKGASDQQLTLVAALEAKVQLLNSALDDANSALDEKDRMLALDKDFLSHDRDIRDLIGARNLYIADIYDTNANGKTAKPFGRIFYTQDRSLVFYGFDLEKQAGLAHAVAFQVWGSGTDRPPVSLGLFYQDDGHKRWVLRCDDAKTLARLNMVFVTVEPPGGSSKPTGKQLLRAYLQIQPNHP